MDTEDRDHFQTIAQEERQKNSQASSTSGLDPRYCLQRAHILFGSYRKDDANNPEIYCAAISAALSQYSKEVVDLATDPRTGLASIHKWPPSVSEVFDFCNAAAERQRKASVPRIPLLKFASPDKPPPHLNLFVPSDVRGYDRMIEKGKEDPTHIRHERRACADGRVRDGVSVPLSWFNDQPCLTQPSSASPGHTQPLPASPYNSGQDIPKARDLIQAGPASPDPPDQAQSGKPHLPEPILPNADLITSPAGPNHS